MRSLRVRLLVLWLLSLLACAAVGVLLVQLYRQSSTAQTGQAEAVIARACDLVRDRYAFYTAGWRGPAPSLSDTEFRGDLTAAVTLALARQEGVEGGIWQTDAGSLAYAFPTYPGGERKTDLPAAEEERIQAVNGQAAREEQPVTRIFASRTQTLLLQACPLGGPIPGLTAWTMTRVPAAPGFERLRLGLGVLLALVLGSSGWLTWLVAVWARHIGAMEAALAREDSGTIPVLAPTGERELDRIVAALNGARRRLEASRRRSEELVVRVGAAERLAALGRVAAGVAHEIRNPIAAMRLRAENALAGDDARRRRALTDMLAQIARLDGLVSELLAMTQRHAPQPVSVALGPFLAACADRHRDEAARRGVAIATDSRVERACLDPEIAGRILDNLLLNALRHVREDSGRVDMVATEEEGQLRIVVADTGPGVAPELREHLFEPFVTGRADGTGLGLAIARELADAHGGRLSLLRGGGDALGKGAAFALDLPQEAPCPPS
jgi:signal transduction histidine kinase